MPVNILECRRFSSTYSLTKKVMRTVKDYEIDLELGHERLVVIDEVPQLIRRGNICVRKPGQVIYGLSTQASLTQISILLTVDFSGQQSGDYYSRNIDGPIQKHWDSPLLDQLGGVIVPYSENTFIPIYNELLSLAFTDREAAETLVMELIYRLNAEVCRQNYIKNKPTETPCSKVLNHIKNNLEQEITLESLAELVHLDKNYLVRLFKDTYGQTPIKTLIDMRMERACDLITNTNMTISDIATACGYSSASYFTAEYKKRYGNTPLRQRLSKQ